MRPANGRPELASASAAGAVAGSKNSVGPDALRRSGALFRVSRNFWDAADDISAEETLGLRARRRGCLVRYFWAPFRPGMWTATALRPRSRRGHAFWSGGVIPTSTFCRLLPCGAAYASP